MEKWGYREYRQWILSEMRMYYPPNEGFAVYTQWIEKNNISLEALIIRHVTEQEVPVFYLKDFYGAYRGGVPLQGTAMHICRLYECRRQLRAPFGELSDFGAASGQSVRAVCYGEGVEAVPGAVYIYDELQAGGSGV